MNWPRMLWILNPILALVVAGSFISTHGEASKARAKIDRKRADLEKLAALEKSGSGPRAYRGAFERLSETRPVDLGQLLDRTVPGLKARIRPDVARRAGGGWQTRTVRVEIDRIELDRLGVFLQQAESQRPPWRLVDCEIVAADEGGGKVSLVLVALEKNSAQQVSDLR
ncbi:MAG: hypothetical protein AAF492_12930 [Verrucomicrobiota bacterium]